MLEQDQAGPQNGEEQTSTEVPADASANTSAFSVELEFTSESDTRVPRVCYALAHNRIPFVSSMTLRVTDSSSVETG